jgi:hypothetical protein
VDKSGDMDISEMALSRVLEGIRNARWNVKTALSNEWIIAVIQALRTARTTIARYEAMAECGPFIDIVFDRIPDKDGANFIEVENQDGASISVGQWLIRERDGRVVLRIPTGGTGE